MKVYIERDDDWRTVSFSGSAADLCRMLSVNPQTVLVVKDDELVPEDEDITGAEEIKLITVVSGG